MTIVDVLLNELNNAHEILEGTMEGVTQKEMEWIPPGKANSIGSTYAHLVLSEDMIVNGVLSNREPLFKTDYANKAGINKLMPVPGTNWEESYYQWTRSVQTDLPQLRHYAAAVFDRSLAYLPTLNDNDLENEVDLTTIGMGKTTALHVITAYLVAHTNNIAGEISALKGILGLKGYPF